jgi:hypothetical protein
MDGKAISPLTEQTRQTPLRFQHSPATGLLPNARLKIIPGGAQGPQRPSPEVFPDAIGEFLPA